MLWSQSSSALSFSVGLESRSADHYRRCLVGPTLHKWKFHQIQHMFLTGVQKCGIVTYMMHPENGGVNLIMNVEVSRVSAESEREHFPRNTPDSSLYMLRVIYTLDRIQW